MNNSVLRIAHICLASSYTEGMLYQDNVLPDVNRSDGHEVLVVSDCTCFVDGKIAITPEEDRILANGIRLVRLPFGLKFLPKSISSRIKYTPNLPNLLNEFKPDVILYHSLVGVAMRDVANYKRANPCTRLFFDSHADFNNSGRRWFSRTIQYSIFNRLLWRSISALVEKVFYVSIESKYFLRDMYGIRDEAMKFYPLGGFVQDETVKIASRNRVRKELLFLDEDIVFIHAGKLNKMKKTMELINVFSELPNTNYRLIIVGKFEDDISETACEAIKSDDRVNYLGWKSGAELVNLLLASDCYVQPGTQSATLQAAICCGLPIIVFPYESHFDYLSGNGYFVENSTELKNALINAGDIEKNLLMSGKSIDIGRRILDYRALAMQLYK